MFNLNDASFGGGATVFNNGNTGKVENVKMSVTKKGPEDADNAPDYKLIFTDVSGGQINQGFYYHKNNDMYDDKKNKDLETYLLTRVVSAAKSVIDSSFEFPNFNTSKEALDFLFKTIKEQSPDKLVNVYVTYGTNSKPSQYLSTRYFNFVENAETSANMSRLKPSPNDMMVKLQADAPSKPEGGTSGTAVVW